MSANCPNKSLSVKVCPFSSISLNGPPIAALPAERVFLASARSHAKAQSQPVYLNLLEAAQLHFTFHFCFSQMLIKVYKACCSDSSKPQADKVDGLHRRDTESAGYSHRRSCESALCSKSETPNLRQQAKAHASCRSPSSCGLCCKITQIAQLSILRNVCACVPAYLHDIKRCF